MIPSQMWTAGHNRSVFSSPTLDLFFLFINAVTMFYNQKYVQYGKTSVKYHITFARYSGPECFAEQHFTANENTSSSVLFLNRQDNIRLKGSEVL